MSWFDDIARVAQQSVAAQGNQVASQAALQQAASSAQAFKSAASSGQFSVDPAAVDELVTKIDKTVDRLVATSRHLRVTEQQVPLGTSPGAQAMKPFLQTVATGHPQSLGIQVQALRQILEDTKAGLLAAKRSYQGVDHGSAVGINKSGGAH
jgi:hypothetical protein